MRAWLIAGVLLAAPAADRLRGEGRTVEMSAQGGLKIDLAKQIGVATGDVVIERDDIIVCCDEATAHYSGRRIERVECRGRVAIVRPDGTRARADLAVFEASEDRVTLTGGAKLRSKEADLAGEAIVYDIGRDTLDVRGAKSRFRFAPAELAPLALDRKCPP